MDKIIVHTDGACKGNPGPSGIGIVINNNNTIHKYSEYLGNGTNNIAELTAVLLTLQIINDKKCKVEINTDSQYVIGALQKNYNVNKNQKLIKQIKDEIKKFNEVKFVKVKAHSTNYYNNMADQLAVDAIENS